jgi:hypothetical protein
MLKIYETKDGQLLVVGEGRPVFKTSYTCPCCGEGFEFEAGYNQGELLCALCQYEEEENNPPQ